MNYNDLSKLFNYSSKESRLFMPNEIFDDLKDSIRSSPHIAFAYSYVYLCTWLYRHAKHFNTGVFDNKKIKEILGYSSKNQSLDYLIKKDGLLDRIEYTKSTKDYPISWKFYSAEKFLEFEMYSEYEDFKNHLPTIPKRFFLKYPNKAFDRIEIEDGEEFDIPGTFHEIKNTHNISFEVFMYCMTNKEIGCNGFYLYSFLKHKNDIFTEGYDISLDGLSDSTGMSRRSVNRYMDALKGYKMVNFRHNQEYFVIDMDSKDRKSNTYITRDYEFFNSTRTSFKKMSVISEEKYLERMNQKEKLAEDIDDQMPF